MYCQKCGTKLEDNAKFCPECGQRIISYTDIQEEVIDDSISDEISDESEKKSNKKEKILVAIVLAVALELALKLGLGELIPWFGFLVYFIAIVILTLIILIRGIQKKPVKFTAFLLVLAVISYFVFAINNKSGMERINIYRTDNENIKVSTWVRNDYVSNKMEDGVLVVRYKDGSTIELNIEDGDVSVAVGLANLIGAKTEKITVGDKTGTKTEIGLITSCNFYEPAYDVTYQLVFNSVPEETDNIVINYLKFGE